MVDRMTMPCEFDYLILGLSAGGASLAGVPIGDRPFTIAVAESRDKVPESLSVLDGD